MADHTTRLTNIERHLQTFQHIYSYDLVGTDYLYKSELHGSIVVNEEL